MGKGKLQEEHDCVRTEWKLLGIHCIITCQNIQISYTYFFACIGHKQKPFFFFETGQPKLALNLQVSSPSFLKAGITDTHHPTQLTPTIFSGLTSSSQWSFSSHFGKDQTLGSLHQLVLHALVLFLDAPNREHLSQETGMAVWDHAGPYHTPWMTGRRWVCVSCNSTVRHSSPFSSAELSVLSTDTHTITQGKCFFFLIWFICSWQKSLLK